MTPISAASMLVTMWRRLPLRWCGPATWGVIGLALITLFFTTTQSAFSVYTFDTVMLASIGAIALQVLQGTAGLVSVGNAGFLLIGAFGTVFLMRANVPFPLDIIGASVMAGAIGLIAGLPALRLRSLFLALSTLALYFVAVFLGTTYENHVPSANNVGFFVPILFSSAGPLGGPQRWAWLLLVIVGFFVLGARCIMTGRSGRAFRMMRDHEHFAPVFGISVARYKLALFVLSSLAIGLQGGLTAYFAGIVSVDSFTLLLSFQYVAMIMIGGRDSILGAVLGAALVIALPNVVPSIVGSLLGQHTASANGSNIATIVYGVIVIVFVTSSRDGIVGILQNTRRLVTDRFTDKGVPILERATADQQRTARLCSYPASYISRSARSLYPLQVSKKRVKLCIKKI